ncbi:MAG: hypothetical protein LQ339_001644 [Xanthoria mediterranea]|nr:MAG: hypothetical protein LQ339_001644 [Xanthoria mediterranea]
MALFSYTIALAITRDSDTENRQGLPSPFQLQLLISSLEGSLLSLWSFIRYLFSRKRRGVAVVSNLWKAVSLFSITALLALLIAMTDAWLNFSVSTVQYTSRDALPSDDLARSTFTPGRGLRPAYMDLPRMAPEELNGTTTPIPTDSEWEQMAACYTTLQPIEDSPESTAESMKQSEPIEAGLELSGNASDIRNASLFLSAGYGFVVEYYTDSTMSTISNEMDVRGPTLWYAVLLQLPVTFVTYAALLEYEVVTNHTGLSGNRTVTPTVGLEGPGDTGDLFTSILSCTTVLSDVKYSSINGSVKDDTWTAMSQSASPAFVIPIGNYLKAAWAQVQQGAQDAIGNATSAEEVASTWAKTYDQVVISLGASSGMLLNLPPLSAIQSTTTQVTRIPRAPFITLVVLDLVYAIIGTYLMVAALIAVRKGNGVRDAQARLSTLAVVAESFESPALGDDARDINMLFAERRGRGESTRRVALVRRNGGGRRFKQIVVPRNYVKGTSTWNTV